LNLIGRAADRVVFIKNRNSNGFRRRHLSLAPEI
jgi:hypothetical protein